MSKPNKPFDPTATRTRYCVNYIDVITSDSFGAMRPEARLLVLLAKQFYNRKTQGPIFVSVRMVAQLLGIKGLGKAKSLREEVVHHGFWRKLSDGLKFGTGKGVAATYALTDEPFCGKPATLDFLRWDGVCYWPKTEILFRSLGTGPVPKLENSTCSQASEQKRRNPQQNPVPKLGNTSRRLSISPPHGGASDGDSPATKPRAACGSNGHAFEGYSVEQRGGLFEIILNGHSINRKFATESAAQECIRRELQ